MLYAIIALSIIAIALIAATVVSGVIYEKFFSERYETPENLRFYMKDFPHLNRDEHVFKSNRRQKLKGYLYYTDKAAARGLLVLAHGFGGGGHNSYMDCVNRFAKSGYLVFAYDATGNDESDGKGISGLPQGVIDLDAAIRYIRHFPEYAQLPLLLFGHSWGGYCVSSVLKYHPYAKAAIAISGFNRSIDLIAAHGERIVGKRIKLLIGFVKLYEILKFGKYGFASAMSGFGASNAKLTIVHSSDDTVVPIKYGYDIYYKKYSNDPRFRFIKYDDKGHSSVYCSYDAIKYINELYERLYAWRNELEYVWYKSENEARYQHDKKLWLIENTDHAKRVDMLDEAFFDRLVAFFDSAV